MKRTLQRIIFLSAMLLTAVTTFAYDFYFDGIYYNIIDKEAKTVEVTSRDLYYKSYSGKIYLPPSVIYDDETYKVTSIGDAAFRDCSKLTSVTIPNSVSSIGEDAFFRCTGLTSISIPKSVTSIGESAFSGCSGLNKVEISDLAAWCNIDFGNANSNPIWNAYSLYLNGEKIKDLVIPDGVSEIKKYAFEYGKSFTSVKIPKSVTSIRSNAFAHCSGLTKVEISDLAAWCNIDFGNDYSNPLRYAEHMYLSGEEIKDLVIPDGVSEIKWGAFQYGKSFTSVKIPKGVTSIGNVAFADCSGLTKVEISDLAAWCNIDFGYRASNPLVYARRLYLNGEEIKDLVIPDGVSEIKKYAFEYGKSFTSVKIPKSVTSIGSDAFSKCEGLTKVEISDLAAWCNIVFRSEYSNPLVYARRLYLNGEEIKDLVIPNGVSEIKNYAFRYGKGFTSVAIPNSVTSIGKNAFEYCADLKTINSYAVTPPEIYTNTFSDFSAALHVPKGTKEDYQMTSYWYLFNNMTDDLDPSAGVEEIGSDVSGEPQEIYDMRGVKVGVSTEGLVPGIYIVKQGCKVKKIAIQ